MSQQGPLGAAASLRLHLHDNGVSVDNGVTWLGEKELNRAVRRWHSSKSASSIRSFRNLSPGCHSGYVLASAIRQQNAEQTVSLDQYHGQVDGVFGPGSLPTTAALQPRGSDGRLILRVRAGIYPRSCSPTPELTDKVAVEMTRRESSLQSRGLQAEWVSGDWASRTSEEKGKIRKAWADHGLRLEPHPQPLEKDRRGVAAAERTIPRMRRAIARSSASVGLVRLATRVVDELSAKIRTFPSWTACRWWTGASVRGWTASSSDDLYAAMRAQDRRGHRVARPRGLMHTLERIWAREMAASLRCVLRERE